MQPYEGRTLVLDKSEFEDALRTFYPEASGDRKMDQDEQSKNTNLAERAGISSKERLRGYRPSENAIKHAMQAERGTGYAAYVRDEMRDGLPLQPQWPKRLEVFNAWQEKENRKGKEAFARGCREALHRMWVFDNIA